MSDSQNVQHMLAEAKRAADAGEFASADVLLQDVARIQEAELGPLHPDLANTVNNLGIVAEMNGRLDDAEKYYRRAVAITSASLPPDDPLVASSRKNLEDFCRERGLPFEPPPVVPAVHHVEHRSEEVVSNHATNQAKTSANVQIAHADIAAQTSTSVSERRSAADSAIAAADRSTATARASTRSLAVVAIGLVVVVAVVFFIARPSPRESPPPDSTREPAPPRAAEPAPPQAAPAPPPNEQPQPATVPPRDDKAAVAASPRARTPSSGGLTLVTSQLCRSFSVGNNWRCDPVREPVSPGPIVLYTRVKSPRNAIVIHHWYRGNTLRKSARLTVLANTTEGYRTYSRQTVKSGEDWRVEVTNTDGDVLYEQRVSVR